MSEHILKKVGMLLRGWRAMSLAVALALSPMIANAERVVVAMNPPTVETNLFWMSGPGEPLPWMQSLVGNDPVTGVYDDSGLAKSWSSNADMTEWTFVLHENAQFHNGWGPVTANDVVHSYNLHTSADATYGGKALILAKEVVALDDHTVVFRFETPHSNYTFYHAGRYEMLIYSKAQFDAEGIAGYERKPAGSAPYQFVERRPGEGVVLAAVPDHWQGSQPDFDELELRWAREPAVKLAMLLSGEADIVQLPRDIQKDALARGMKIVSSQNAAMQSMMILNGQYLKAGDEALGTAGVPWSDIRVREAMNRAINRDEMIDVLYDGRADKLIRWGADPRHEGWRPDMAERFDAMYGYDPARAKALLDEAGYPGKFAEPVIPIVLTELGGNPEFGTMAEMVQAYFEAVGLQTKMVEMDWASLGALGRAKTALVVNPMRNAPVRPSEAALVTFFTARGAPYGGYQNDGVENKIDTLVATTDPAERDRLTGEIFNFLFENYVDMPIASVKAEIVVNPTVVNDWTFPGVTTISLGHWHLIKKAN